MGIRPRFWVSPAEAVFVIAGVLFLIGLINIFSSSFILAGKLSNDSYFFVKRQLLAFLVGFVLLLFAALVDYRRINRGWVLFLALLTLLLLVAVHLGGEYVNGARRWLKIASFQFQPSEMAKLSVVLLCAAYLGPKLDRERYVSLNSWPLYIALLLSLLVLKQPDMGTAVVILGLGLILYVFAGIPWSQLLVLLVTGSALTVYLVYAAAYRFERIWAWIDPWSYQQTTGYQMVQSLLAMGSGGLLGVGVGQGASKYFYLPEAHTDFAFAVLCQEMGFAGALVVMALFALLGWYGIKTAIKAPDGFGMMLAAGATTLIVGQGLGNMAMVAGLVPVTGVPLPFISFGGTSLIVNMAAVGLLISVGRRGASPVSAEKTEKTSLRARLKLVRSPGRDRR
ncbi:MAG TPA: putative peptidoglycan glycosyltransferase FtsW [Patescibacteria group bacterium]|nr:putative peptidoglycan glycosyltransferase FtsW [Patescibacteria group bacterium]